MEALVNNVLASQMRAALEMLKTCITHCPDDHWDTPIAKYPFWQVAYHTLCFVDVYLSPSDTAWAPMLDTPERPGLHPRGRAELEEEYPSRRFARDELLAYAEICHEKITRTFAAETAETLAGPSGFPRLTFTRAELHLYNLRHIQHHAGALAAFLHREGGSVKWVRSG